MRILKERNLQGLRDEVEAIEGGRYIALSVKVNDVANIALQLTSATTHRIILNVKPISDRKVDRILFDNFVDTIPSLRSRAGGSYAKFSHWQGLKLSAGDHEALGDPLAFGLVLALGLGAAFGSGACPWAANAFAAFFLSLDALRFSALVLG